MRPGPGLAIRPGLAARLGRNDSLGYARACHYTMVQQACHRGWDSRHGNNKGYIRVRVRARARVTARVRDI